MAEPIPPTPPAPRTPVSGLLTLLRNGWRRVENVVFGLVLVLIGVYFVLQTPVVQNWLVGKVTAYLSDELKTTVRVQHLDFEFFDKLVLDGVYVQDLQGDTLLYAEQLTAGLSANIFSLLDNRLEFDDVSLEKARFNIRRAAGEYDNSLQFLLDYFSTPNADNRPKKPFKVRFTARNVHLHDVEFVQDDEVSGQKMRAAIVDGNIQLNQLDLVANVIDIRSVVLSGLMFNLIQYPAKPLPPRAPVVQPVQTPLDSLAAGTLGKYEARPLLRFSLGSFSLDQGYFSMDRDQKSPARTTEAGVMDFNHLLVQDIGLQAENIISKPDSTYEGRLLNLTAREQSGFQLTHGEAARVVVGKTLLALYGVNIQTPQSAIGDTIAFNYNERSDFRQFNTKVRMDIRLSAGSHLRLGDIAHFSGGLARNTFFNSNRETVASISGLLNGTVNNLNGRNLDIRLGNRAFMHGNFDGDDLTKGADVRRLNFDFKQLQSDIQTIRNIIPGFNAPQYFDRLGNIGFSGTYQVLFSYNHLLNGRLTSDIGAGNVDMELDLTGGRERAIYSGNLNLSNFDLGAWTGNRNFGKTTFNLNIADGSTGLTLSTLRAKLRGQIDTLYFKGYNYKNVKLDGAFEKKLFAGKVGIEDPNVDFVFDGSIDLRDTTPVFIFKTDIRRLDLGKLNLSKKNLIISGKVEQLRIAADNWSDLTGTAMLRNFVLQGGDVRQQIDSLQFSSSLRSDGSRYFEVVSDLLEASIEGDFNLKRAPRELMQLFSRYHPEFAARLGFPLADSVALVDNFVLHIAIKNTGSLTQLFAPGLDTLTNIIADGRVDAAEGSTNLSITIPKIKYNNLQAQNIVFRWSAQDEIAQYYLRIPQSSMSRTKLAPIRLEGQFRRNELSFKLTARDSNTIVRGVNLDGVLSTIDSLWQIKFNSSDIALFNEQWVMSEDNYLRFGKGFLATQEFEFFNGDQRIRLDSINGGRGLSLSLTNFDLDFLNRFTASRNLNFRGKIYDFDVTVDEIFQLKGINTYITTDTIFINNVPYGEITGNLDMADQASPLAWTLFLNRDRKQVLRVVGGWLAGGDKPRRLEELELTVPPGEFLTSITARDFPLAVLQTFVPGISKVAGQFRADVTLSGPFSGINMSGGAVINTGQFQLDYLKTMYYVRNQKIDLSGNRIYATGDTIYDASQRHMAFIRGGLLHKHFKEWRVNCSVRSADNNFMILNTSAQDNLLYYGQAIGQFEANFSGTFRQTNISITATTGKETRLYIPISSVVDAQDVRFIKFKSKKDTVIAIDKTKSFTIGDLKGLNFEMSVTVTQDAEVQLIFDEQAGDIIKGRGEGDLKLVITREGEFKMYGNYTILTGEYLFTLLNWVNKPFTVSQGGVVSWSGDPFGAQINLDATYVENTSLYNFVRDEVELLRGTPSDLATDASKATQVIVTMHLNGDLLKPNISFDLEFPNLSSQIKTIADNKLRLLRQDQNELNRQVFGLVVVGSFLPSSSSGFIQGSDYLTSAFNTLTQVLSNQFSNYLTGLATEWFGGRVSSIDFDVAYNEYQNSLREAGQPNANQTGRELQLRLTSGLFNDRITVQFGSQFGLGSPGTSTNDGFLGEDAVVEIQLTENRHWRLKVYQRTEPDIGGGQLRARYGFGLSFRREYDTFSELMDGLIWWKRKSS